MKTMLGAAALAAVFLLGGRAAHAADDILPNAALSNFLTTLPIAAPRGEEPVIAVGVSEVSSDSIYADAVTAAAAQGAPLALPAQIASRLTILLDPSLSPDAARAALDAYRLVPIAVAPEIGAVVVDASPALDRPQTDETYQSVAAWWNAPVNRLARRLARDKRFAAVGVESFLSGASIVSAVRPAVEPLSRGPRAERTDWGIKETGADKLWPLLNRPVTVGVIDGGFAAHEDLPLAQGLPNPWSAEDHGNHVAGIMCARHNDVGVKGVLPICGVAATGGVVLLPQASRVESAGEIGFHTRFSEYVATVLDFMEANPDAKVINISLGYNWMPNFKIDPRSKDMARIRDLVRGQGRIFQSVLAYAKRRDVVIFAAAGNDSTDLATPLPAEWASPFNFGAKLMLKTDGWSNGIVVEAYDRSGKRTRFSNVGGDVACPGADVLSAIASPKDGYGTMSGTSMASPYCAAGFAAVRSLLPQVSTKRAVECFLAAPSRIEGRVPRANFLKAFETCRAGS